MGRTPFHFLTKEKIYNLWSCQKVNDPLHDLLDNIFIRFGSKVHGHTDGIPVLLLLQFSFGFL